MTNKIAQINEDWQEGIKGDLLTLDDEVEARSFINRKLREWRVAEDDENINDYIMRAWDEWTAIRQVV